MTTIQFITIIVLVIVSPIIARQNFWNVLTTFKFRKYVAYETVPNYWVGVMREDGLDVTKFKLKSMTHLYINHGAKLEKSLPIIRVDYGYNLTPPYLHKIEDGLIQFDILPNPDYKQGTIIDNISEYTITIYIFKFKVFKTRRNFDRKRRMLKKLHQNNANTPQQ